MFRQKILPCLYTTWSINKFHYGSRKPSVHGVLTVFKWFIHSECYNDIITFEICSIGFRHHYVKLCTLYLP